MLLIDPAHTPIFYYTYFSVFALLFSTNFREKRYSGKRPDWRLLKDYTYEINNAPKNKEKAQWQKKVNLKKGWWGK